MFENLAPWPLKSKICEFSWYWLTRGGMVPAHPDCRGKRAVNWLLLITMYVS